MMKVVSKLLLISFYWLVGWVVLFYVMLESAQDLFVIVVTLGAWCVVSTSLSVASIANALKKRDT